LSNLHTIELHRGDLRLEALVSGPAQGPVVFLVHGFPDTPYSWNAVADGLALAGYRVVRPWLRGYTAGSVSSSAEYGPYPAALDLLGWREVFQDSEVHLVGHDWGAVAGMAAAAINSSAWKTLSVLAIPPFQKVERAWRLLPRQMKWSSYMLEMQSGTAPMKVMKNDCSRLRALWEQWSPGWQFTGQDFLPVQQAFSSAEVAWAATRYYRSLFTLHKASTRAMFALSRKPLNVPTLALAGVRDGCMQAELLKVMVEPACFPKGIRVQVLNHCGHFLHAEQPEAVLKELLAHLG
jgi:pimeloyl-ACP methyl ester carboxylesterase